MKKEVLNELEKINEKNKIPEEAKQKISKKIYRNVIISIFIIAYFLMLFIGDNMAERATRTIGFNIFSMILLILSIVAFEVSYKKDNDELAINGIEILVIAIITLFMPYMYFESAGKTRTIYMLSPVFVGIYYSIKCIVINIKEKRKYRESINEIKDLVKREKAPEIDLEEKRIARKKIEEESNIEIAENKETNKLEKDKENSEKKKTTKTSTKSTKKTSSTTKKTKTTTKPTTTKRTTNTRKKIENKISDNQEVKSKKRGRPKKVQNT